MIFTGLHKLVVVCSSILPHGLSCVTDRVPSQGSEGLTWVGSSVKVGNLCILGRIVMYKVQGCGLSIVLGMTPANQMLALWKEGKAHEITALSLTFYAFLCNIEIRFLRV